MVKEVKEKKEEEVVNQPKDAPIAPSESPVPASMEVLSHQWQENSPALNTNAIAGYGVGENLVEKLKAAEEEVKEEKKEKTISEAEYERRTKLDVSHAEYINPSLNHVKVK
jgi:hypothetical protein